MTLLFFDICDYSPAIEVGWNAGANPSYTGTGGPFNTRYMSNPGVGGSNTLARTLGVNAAKVTLGFWYREPSAFAATQYWRFDDVATAQVSWGTDASGHHIIKQSTAGTTLATSTPTLTLNTWQYIEVQIVFGNSGSVIVHQDGVEVLNVTAIDTTQTANNYCNRVAWAPGSSTKHIDDIYMLDDQGSINNDFLGPVKGYLLSPTADGAHTDFTPNTGTRWQAVDEAPTADDDTTYISDNTAGHKNSVALANTAAGIGQIHGVAHYARMRRDDAGPHTARAGLRVNGTDYPAATETLTASYVGYNYLRETSPDTGVRFTSSELDGTEHYVETVS